MYKLTNNSTTNLSVNGINLAPGQCMKIENISESLRYLEDRGSVHIQPVLNFDIKKPVVEKRSMKKLNQKKSRGVS